MKVNSAEYTSTLFFCAQIGNRSKYFKRFNASTFFFRNSKLLKKFLIKVLRKNATTLIPVKKIFFMVYTMKTALTWFKHNIWGSSASTSFRIGSWALAVAGGRMIKFYIYNNLTRLQTHSFWCMAV
jgi:hypothetical protein